MADVKIYVENRLLDLYSDEQIVVNSTGQSLTDLSGLVTDYTQTFTVPTTKVNNQIFEHYYNNDLDGLIDQNQRRTSRIEINGVVFRRGKLQLQKSSVENGQSKDYTADFFGDIVTLKDLVGEDKLSDLNYSSISHAYSAVEVLNRIDGTTAGDVKYPLISSDRVWENGGGTPNDITTGAGSILFTELFPAIRMDRILRLIQSRYGITFSSAWLLSPKWKELYMWFKNKETPISMSPALPFVNDNDVNFTNGYIFGTLHYTYRDPLTLVTTGTGGVYQVRHFVSVDITTATASPYYLDVFKNGTLFTTLQSQGGNTTFDIISNQYNTLSLNEFLTFEIRSSVSATFNGDINYTIKYRDTLGGGTIYMQEDYTNAIDTIVTTAFTNFASLAPDMKVTDFLKGVLGYCNGVLIGNGSTSFQIKPLDDYFNEGSFFDITRYVDEEKIEYNRPPLYKNINFEYQESKSILNRGFYDLFTRNFADLVNGFTYDGSDYKVQLPFESILSQKFSGTDLQVGYCVDTSPKGYIPKPVVLYALPLQTGVSFKFDTSTTVTQYIPFGQDLIDGLENYTSCFGLEVSSFLLTAQPNGLYATYYENYISNLYNPKTRLVKLKTNLPLNVINKIKLNSKLIIGKKTYIIVDMKTNLNTNDVDFTLLSWWIVGDINKSKLVSSEAQSAKFYFDSGDSTINITDIDGTPFTSLSPLTGSGVFTVTVDVDANATGLFRSLYYNYTKISPTGDLESGIIEIAQES